MTTIPDRRNRVVVAPVVPRVITLDRATVARMQAAQRVIPRESPVNAIVRPENPRVVASGMGAPGKDGINGGGTTPPVTFSFGDAPHPVFTAVGPGTLTVCRIVMKTPFNGAPSSIRLGTSADPENVMRAEYVDLASTSEFENTPDIHMADGDEVLIALSVGIGATAGDGIILFTFVPD